jgi:hypothetical protein
VGLKPLGELFAAAPIRWNEFGPTGIELLRFDWDIEAGLLLEFGVTGLIGFDNTKDGSRRVSAVRGDNAGEGIDVGGIPYGWGCMP